MIKIGYFSKLSRISIRMLRHYDEIGLLVPDSVDPLTSYRYYSESQLPIANRITTLKEMGFGLAAIREILNCYDNPEKLAGFLDVKRIEILEHEQEIKHQILLLDTAIERLRKDGTMSYHVILKEIPAREVASVRKIIPTYAHEGDLWKILWTETAPLHITNAEQSYPIALYHDGEFKEHDVDVEIQLAINGSYSDTEHVMFKKVPAVQVASATFQGSYDKINEVNEAVVTWVKENDYIFDGLAFNIYYSNPGNTSSPDEFVTEVCYPVRKK